LTGLLSLSLLQLLGGDTLIASLQVADIALRVGNPRL
jgi:hypothetical protein